MKVSITSGEDYWYRAAFVNRSTFSDVTRQRKAHTHGERDFRRRIRIGGVTLAIALAILAGSVWLRSQLSNIEGRALVQGLGEGLLIFGWVAMWRPVEILLFEHWESHLDHAVLERLASIPVAFVFERAAAPET